MAPSARLWGGAWTLVELPPKTRLLLRHDPVARYFPGAAGFAVAGINPADLLTPALGALLLGTYAVVAVAAGGILMRRRDIT